MNNDMEKRANKRLNIIICIGIVIILGILIMYRNREIGTVSGLEQERITIDGVGYVYCNTDFGASDKGRYLGKVKSADGSIVFRVWSVKGDSQRKYIYTLWFYDGAFYVREDMKYHN